MILLCVCYLKESYDAAKKNIILCIWCNEMCLCGLRTLVVYPWTQRYFTSFGNLYNAEAILSNSKVAAHGVVVLHGLDRAMKNMDDIKNTYAKLSVLHSAKLHVDPDNFRVCKHTAGRLPDHPDVQAAWQKLLAVVVSALADSIIKTSNIWGKTFLYFKDMTDNINT
uniref:Hemoglobin subunit alpha-like n=1 Tax=Sinocyclocheilus rhinocerous TaxID=307959 RepID=A0A673JRS1_9TELE